MLDQLAQDIRDVDRCSQNVAERIAALRARRPEEGVVPLIGAKSAPAPIVPYIAPVPVFKPSPGRPAGPRHVAAGLGNKTYDGTPHSLCGTTLRYTGGGACVHCAKLQSAAQVADRLALRAAARAEAETGRKIRDAHQARLRIERAEKKLLVKAMEKKLKAALKLAAAAVKAEHAADIQKTWTTIQQDLTAARRFG